MLAASLLTTTLTAAVALEGDDDKNNNKPWKEAARDWASRNGCDGEMFAADLRRSPNISNGNGLAFACAQNRDESENDTNNVDSIAFDIAVCSLKNFTGWVIVGSGAGTMLKFESRGTEDVGPECRIINGSVREKRGGAGGLAALLSGLSSDPAYASLRGCAHDGRAAR